MIANFFGKLIVKIGIVLSLLIASIAIVIAISDGVFRQASDSMRDLGEVRVPDLLENTNALVATATLQQSFSDLLLADDAASVEKARDAALSTLEDLSTLPPDGEDASGVHARVKAIDALIGRLADARVADFRTEAAVATAVAALQQNVDSISSRLSEAEDVAYFDLALNGEATVDAVGATLDTLVEKDFSSLRLALQVRSAANELSGMTLAYGQTSDPSLRSILLDLMTSARTELEQILPELAKRPELSAMEAPVVTFLAAVQAEGGGRVARLDVTGILAARGEVDKVVVTAIDEIEFNLFLAAADAKDGNAATIRNLIDVQVAGIRDGARLASLMRQTVILALEAVVTDNADRIAVLQAAIRPLAAELEAAAATSADAELAAGVTALVALVHPEDGVAALRLAGLDARAEAARLATEAAAATADIAVEVSSGMDGSLVEVTSSASGLLAGLSAARDQMWNVGSGAAVLVLLAVLLTWMTVVRPLGRVTRLTERLAAGDLSPISGMDRWHGEVGRMVTALKVFRDGMSERAALEADRRRAEAEALRRAHEQEKVVQTLAASFQRLSEGDLDVKIGDDFPEDYQGLRADFNAAIERLSTLLRAVADLGDRIRASSHEISGTSHDISTRTEVAAATLQSTVSELAGLAQSVRESADRVADAAKLGSGARQDAEASVTVIRKSLELMSSIAEAFKRISAVIGLIDDIAFQTNLLALNAGVEAARAGDAGRGFAVVASEVRALAQRSSDAARDIKRLIVESDTLVATGVQATGQAGQSLSGIVEAVIAMADRIEQISISSGAQSATIADVSRAASGLDQNMQYNVARFEETTAASRILSEEAKVLSNRLQEFRLPDPSAASLGIEPATLPGVGPEDTRNTNDLSRPGEAFAAE